MSNVPRAFILAGMQFGDEGKGSFVDYIASAQNINQIVRYNGGSQASHTVVTPQGTLHKFSQLGSAMFLDGRQTFITGNVVINPFNLIEEAEQFSEKTKQDPQGVLKRITIDENCYIVTPYHKLVNQMREIREADARRGSVGTGVSEVRRIHREINAGIQIKDLHNQTLLVDKLGELFRYAKDFHDANNGSIFRNIPESISQNLSRGVAFLLDSGSIPHLCNEYQSLMELNNFRISQNICAGIEAESGIIFEGAQGLLLDETYGFKPNTTILDTTIRTAVNLSKELGVNNTAKAGIAKAFMSRHGIGAFPTKAAELNAAIKDANQESSYWNGAIRFGWFDAVLVRYAQMVNGVDEIYLSSVDKLDSLDKLRICDSYQYFGDIDDEFEAAFEYEKKGGYAIISNILENTNNISKYLHQCVPVYIDLKGWMSDTTQAKEASALPGGCLEYIAKIARLTGVKVSAVSVGPTRNEKVVL